MSAPSTISFDRPQTIDVDRLEPLRTGRNNRTGRAWTLYRVHASQRGIPVPEELRTFSRLQGSVEVTAEAFVKDGAITHYTVRPTERARAQYDAEHPPAAPAPEPGRLVALENDVAALRERVEQLEAQLEIVMNVVLAREPAT